MIRWSIAAMLFLCLGLTRAESADFTVVKVDLRSDDLRLYWKDDSGRPLRNLVRLSSWLASQGKRLTFGMNAGMYHADLSPVGLLVIDNQEISPLNLANGRGNFFLKPNGVFLVSQESARIIDAMDYASVTEKIRYATQSGPMLIKNGLINPAFKKDSGSRVIRNGVCAQGAAAFFVISEIAVNFYEFSVFFRDELRCNEALYLDGAVSSLYQTENGRRDVKTALGPMIAVTR